RCFRLLPRSGQLAALVDGIGKRPAARGRTGCLLPAIHRASGLIQSFFEDHSPTRRQSLDTRWRNYPRPELHAFIEKSHCAATSSRGGSCRRRTTDPQRLGRRATLPRCDVPQTPPIPQRTVALSPPVTHRFPRRGSALRVPPGEYLLLGYEEDQIDLPYGEEEFVKK